LKNKPTSSPDPEAEARALLKILGLGEQNVKEGKTVPAKEAMVRFRERLRKRTSEHQSLQ
jgi:hypothetical protein